MGAYVDANLRDAIPPLPHPMVILVTVPLLDLANSSEALVLADVNLDDFIIYRSVGDADTGQTAQPAQPTSADAPIPARFTYLGQFINHDLTFDQTRIALAWNVSVDELLQRHSPANDGIQNLVVPMVGNLSGQNPGLYSSGKTLNVEGQVTSGWKLRIDVPHLPSMESRSALAGPLQPISKSEQEISHERSNGA